MRFISAIQYFHKETCVTPIDLELTPWYILVLSSERLYRERSGFMTIKEVCEKYGITPDTLRYYERVGVIPTVARTKGGIRDYSEEDIRWVENAICMRSAGLPVEMLIEYVQLFREGDSTF